jgi:hypothetical protein
VLVLVLVLVKELYILTKGILNAPFRVMHQAGRKLPGCDRLVQRAQQ